MRPAPALVLAAALLLAPAAVPPVAAQSGAALESLRVSLLEGDVQLRIPEADDWVAAAINTPLRAGDRLWVPDGARVELQLRGGSRVRLNERTALEILRLEPDAAQFYLSGGQAFVSFRGRPGELLQFDTPPAALRATDTAVFRLDVGAGGETDAGVFAGRVHADSARDRRSAGSGNRLILRTDGSITLTALGPTDAWERWNHARDRELADYRASTRYLPAELEPYAYDFDRYGRWVSVADYGWVWTPQLHISVGWAPYGNGRWAWIGGDYVWISYDPWGWVPHHYGRWVFAAGFGWCWVPPVRGAVYWAPGWVGWVHRHPHVAWVPLAPGEIYHGHGRYGPHSVNLLTIDIHRTVIKPDYRNARIAGGVIAVTNDDFIRGRTAAARLELNPFRNGDIRPGRPDIAPTRASYAPRLIDIPRTAAPPESVRNIEPRRLQENRPLLKEPVRTTPRAAPERRAIETRPAAPRTDTPRIEGPRGERAPAIRAPATGTPAERRIETAPRTDTPRIEAPRNIRAPETRTAPAGAPAERRIESAPRELRPSQPAAPVERRIETAPRELKRPAAPSAPIEQRPQTAPSPRPEQAPAAREIERRREPAPESRLQRQREPAAARRVPEAETRVRAAAPAAQSATSSVPAHPRTPSQRARETDERPPARESYDSRRGRD